MKDKYYLNGVENAACIDRIGAGNSIFVYSFGKFIYEQEVILKSI